MGYAGACRPPDYPRPLRGKRNATQVHSEKSSSAQRIEFQHFLPQGKRATYRGNRRLGNTSNLKIWQT